MTKYDFSQFEDYFAREQDFSITKDMYSNMVGAEFPRSMPYAINSSAIAKEAKSHNYRIELTPETVIRFIKND